MTPAIDMIRKAGIEFTVHEYEHSQTAESYGLEAAEKLHLPVAVVFKTLVVKLDGGDLAVAILPVDKQLSMKRMARSAGARKAALADPTEVQRSTGYVLGGVSPLAQKKRLLTVLDDSAEALPTLFVSAGRRGLEIELAAGDLIELTQARVAAVAD